METRKTRAVLFGLLIVSFLGNLLQAYYLVSIDEIIPNKTTINLIINLLPNFIASLIGAAFFFLLYLFTGKKIEDFAESDTKDVVQLIDIHKTAEMHITALKNTENWFTNGHIGRWTRVEAIPYLAKLSKEEGVSTSVKLIILNPKNLKICQLYCNYRNSIKFQDNVIKEPEDIQAEILSTIIVGQLYSHKFKSFQFSTFLNDSLSVFREDISDTVAFRTQVDPNCPAIAYYKQVDNRIGQFYKTAKADFNVQSQACFQISAKINFSKDNITKEEVEEFINIIDNNIPNSMSNVFDKEGKAHENINKLPTSSHFIDKIYQKIHSDYHPYSF